MTDRPFTPQDLGIDAVLAHWRKRQQDHVVAIPNASVNLSGPPFTVKIEEIVKAADEAAQAEPSSKAPELALGFLLDFGAKVDEGMIVRAVTPAWLAILKELHPGVQVLLRLTDREFEELIAGAYRQMGAEVILTPRSGDHGIDVIAVFPKFGTIRILDQAKRYAPRHLVTAGEVREMWATLDRHPRAAKACITTTSGFAPGVYTEFADVMPDRLLLRNGHDLTKWLSELPGDW
jgi:restriction system protein